MAGEKKKSSNLFTDFFSKIETKDDAIKAISAASNVFLSLGTLAIVVGLILFYLAAELWFGYVIEGVLIIILAALLRKFNSRVIAITFLALTSLETVTTFASRFGGGEGGKNIFLAILALAYGVRVTQATLALNKLK